MNSQSAGQSSGYGLRRRSREMALQLLFQSEFVAQPGPSGVALTTSPKDMLRRFVQDFQVEADVADYGSRLFLGVTENVKEIDALIQAHSAHWKTSRMGLVDLSIMRVAVFEMKFMNPAIPPSVAINEAVEIAKKYGTTDSSGFVNGILDHVGKRI